MDRIVVIETGGTIQMKKRGDFSVSINQITKEGVKTITATKKDSADLLFSDWSYIADIVDEEIKKGSDLIVTHGTDAMEEGAFYLAEVLKNPPLVLVGSMRRNDHRNSDGPYNMKIAIDALEKGLAGTALSIGGQLFSAWSAQKKDSLKIDAFEGSSPSSQGNWIGKKANIDPDQVAVVFIGADMTVKSLRKLSDGFSGLVVLAPGAGNVPLCLRKEIEKIAQDKKIVLKTRCFTGPAADADGDPDYLNELSKAGIVVENLLSPAKARVRLLLSLSLGIDYQPFELK